MTVSVLDRGHTDRVTMKNGEKLTADPKFDYSGISFKQNILSSAVKGKTAR